MVHGIAVMGHNGGGKSTLAHALSKQIGYYEMDVEDYYFPRQKASRQHALKENSLICKGHFEVFPFTVSKSKAEVECALFNDITLHPSFVLASTKMDWEIRIISSIEIAFFVETPLEERIRRIQDRETHRFGTRVLPGGDMYEQHTAFLNEVLNQDLNAVYDSAEKLHCPIIYINGIQPVQKNVQHMMEILAKQI